MVIGNLIESIEDYSKKLVRTLAMILGGVMIALLGILVIAVGVIKWLSQIVPPWLSWVVVGIVLLLIGVLLVAVNK
jgi:branched-subunit amino acid permease